MEVSLVNDSNGRKILLRSLHVRSRHQVVNGCCIIGDQAEGKQRSFDFTTSHVHARPLPRYEALTA